MIVKAGIIFAMFSSLDHAVRRVPRLLVPSCTGSSSNSDPIPKAFLNKETEGQFASRGALYALTFFLLWLSGCSSSLSSKSGQEQSTQAIATNTLALATLSVAVTKTPNPTATATRVATPSVSTTRVVPLTPTSTSTLEPPTPVPTPTVIPGIRMGNDWSGDPNGFAPSISGNGQYVAFASNASNLVRGDTNSCRSQWAYEPMKGNCRDIFVYDHQTRSVRRISVASDGAEADGESFSAAISTDGRWVAFRSRASNLVPGWSAACARRDYPDNCSGVYVHELRTGMTELAVLMSDNGGEGRNDYLSISAEGRYLAFFSSESNLVKGIDNRRGNYFVYDRQTRAIMLMLKRDENQSGGSNCKAPQVSNAEGSVAFFCGYDSVPDGAIFNLDRATGAVTWVNASDADLAAGGRYSVFSSEDSNLVKGDTNECQDPRTGPHNCSDIFVYDANTRSTERVSVGNDGQQSNGESYDPSISADGRFVTFGSSATNLTADANPGIFIHDRVTSKNQWIYGGSPRISADGRWVVFSNNGQIFLHDRQTNKTEPVSIAIAK